MIFQMIHKNMSTELVELREEEKKERHIPYLVEEIKMYLIEF